MLELDASLAHIKNSIGLYQKLGLDQVDIHQWPTTFRQGDFRYAYYDSLAEFKKQVVDLLRENGMGASPHTYSHYIDYECAPILSNPKWQKQLGVLEVVTLAEACRMCALENGLESFPMDLTGVQIGPVALIGIPSEVFTDIGVRIKDMDGWFAILPCCLVNGSDCDYVSTQAVYDEGGYEVRSAHYKRGTDDIVVAGGKALLDDLKA